LSILGCFLPYFLFLIWSRSQGVSHKGYVSKPPVPEDRQANRLRDEAVKKRKDAAKGAAARKREITEKHAKTCKIAQTEGAPRPTTPESTEEEDSSGSEFNFSEPDDYEVVSGVSPPSAPRGAGGEGSTVMLGEARPTPGSLTEVSASRTEPRSPTPAAGRGSPAPAASRRSPAPAVGRRLSTPTTGQRVPSPAAGQGSPVPAAGGRTPASAAPTVCGGSTASVETPAQTDSRPRADPRATPPGRSSGVVGVPRARRSGTGKRNMSTRSG